MQRSKTNNKISVKKVDGIVPVSSLHGGKFAVIPNVEYRTEEDNSVVYSGLKLVGIVVLVLAFFAGISSIGSTVSFYQNIERSIGNFMQADPLAFDVLISSSTEAKIDLSRGEVMVVPIMTPKSYSEPIQYFVDIDKTLGDDGLCGDVHLMSTYPFPYDGLLMSLQTGTSTNTGAWSLNFYLQNPDLHVGKSCTVELTYKGWNADVPFGRGYSDTNKISITFFVPEVEDNIEENIESQSLVLSPEVLGQSTTTDEVLEEKEATTTEETNIVVPEPITYGSAPELQPPTTPDETPTEPPAENTEGPTEPVTETPTEIPPVETPAQTTENTPVTEITPPPPPPAPAETAPPPPSETPNE